ncbi:ROK family protein [Lactiplantibacillus pentosus]|uniref:ROK family protein n=3 Tax=Lactiplantibacillus pentosus TaxID=1589 RepID=A0AAX6LH46_LACPE|nr:ROK family protein [Lactiplantibacillus pentosus]AYJ43416.1 ROK family protein [Lactiplantibacillus pentosus]KRK23704.1 xylose repressor [Lactiplantibacillus pentosus DSM 20314]MBU7498078.1 ROK family protein [Lactiplantibacillus pentosus]MCB5220238.1 ROK family protein [Lactiplantibacillus pentosus]MCT3285844.1 ROK family protein [Lactiplantibacillus pentosus]
MENRSISRTQLRNRNLKLVLQQIINHPATSRIAISHELNLNKSTISSLYNSLSADHFIEELGEGAASNVGGRKPIMARLNKKYGYTITFDLGYRQLHAMANYLDAEIIDYQEIDNKGRPIEDMLDECRHFVHEMQSQVHAINGLLGICFSIHGIINDNQIVHSPWIDMHDIDIVKQFKAEFDVPVILENEANLSAIYERDFNAGRDYRNSITLSIHRGIGAGIILDKHLFRGKQGEAGEVGRSLTLLGPNTAGQSVESICSEEAIINRVKRIKQDETTNRQTVVQLYQQHDREVERILSQSCSVIAGLIYNVVTTLNPDAIFINSELLAEAPELLGDIQDNYRDIAQDQLPITLTTNTQFATSLGGCSLITHYVLGMVDYELQFKEAD